MHVHLRHDRVSMVRQEQELTLQFDENVKLSHCVTWRQESSSLSEDCSVDKPKG